MCDETTERELDAYLAKRAISRRDFASGACVSLAVGALPSAGFSATKRDRLALVETKVSITTPDGNADGLFVHPRKGAHPGVVFWPDIHGVRPAHFEMARRLAGFGYSVLAANPYYRTHQGQLFFDGKSIRDPGGRDQVSPHYRALSSETVVADARVLAGWLDRQAAVDTKRGIGAVGFCMTGSWTLRAAAAVPERIKAPCSFHGGGLVTDDTDSPHRLADKISGGVLIAIAENDHERQPDAKDKLVAAFRAAKVPATIEVYEDAMHGWVPTDSRAHHPRQAERAWAQMLKLFEAQLGSIRP